jgi:hypothetical protein
MFLIARDKKCGVHVTIGKHGAACDFPTIIDEVTFPHRKARAVYNQAIQVDQRTSVLPQESTRKFSDLLAVYLDR